jgi:hypothetical protein
MTMHAIRIYEKLRLFQPLGFLFEPGVDMPPGATAEMPPCLLCGKPSSLPPAKVGWLGAKPASFRCAETAIARKTSLNGGSWNRSANQPPRRRLSAICRRSDRGEDSDRTSGLASHNGCAFGCGGDQGWRRSATDGEGGQKKGQIGSLGGSKSGREQ